VSCNAPTSGGDPLPKGKKGIILNGAKKSGCSSNRKKRGKAGNLTKRKIVGGGWEEGNLIVESMWEGESCPEKLGQPDNTTAGNGHSQNQGTERSYSGGGSKSHKKQPTIFVLRRGCDGREDPPMLNQPSSATSDHWKRYEHVLSESRYSENENAEKRLIVRNIKGRSPSKSATSVPEKAKAREGAKDTLNILKRRLGNNFNESLRPNSRPYVFDVGPPAETSKKRKKRSPSSADEKKSRLTVRQKRVQ